MRVWFFPVVIDMDGRIYVRPWQGGLLSGGFEKNPKPIFTEGRNQLEIQNMQEDWDHFGKGGRVKKSTTVLLMMAVNMQRHNVCER